MKTQLLAAHSGNGFHHQTGSWMVKPCRKVNHRVLPGEPQPESDDGFARLQNCQRSPFALFSCNGNDRKTLSRAQVCICLVNSIATCSSGGRAPTAIVIIMTMEETFFRWWHFSSLSETKCYEECLVMKAASSSSLYSRSTLWEEYQTNWHLHYLSKVKCGLLRVAVGRTTFCNLTQFQWHLPKNGTVMYENSIFLLLPTNHKPQNNCHLSAIDFPQISR